MDARKAQMINEFNRKRAAGYVDDQPEAMLNSHLTDSFKEYVLSHYEVKDKSVLQSPEVLQMIYAVEWYDLPR